MNSMSNLVPNDTELPFLVELFESKSKTYFYQVFAGVGLKLATCYPDSSLVADFASYML